MPPGLVRGLSFGIADGRAIFLDTIGDRYFCFPSGLNQQFLDIVQTRSAVAEADPRLQALFDTGQGEPPAPVAPDIASEEVLPSLEQRAPVTLLGAAVVIQTQARFQAQAPLSRKLERLRTRRDALRNQTYGTPANEDLLPLLAAFDRSRFLFNAQDQCLSRSIALGHLLASQRIESQLVIGVRPRPFAAHCWVQIGTRVVNDSLENIRAYVPVLVV